MSVREVLNLMISHIIRKTPHVGNFYPNNQFWAKEGIHLVCVDHTVGEKDRNFHPHCVIRAGRSIRVARSDLITTHARVMQSSRFIPAGRFAHGSSISVEHMKALSDVWPNQPIETYSAFLARHAELIEPIFDQAPEALKSNQLFWRFVYHTGEIAEYQNTKKHVYRKSFAEASFEGVLGLHRMDAGWLPPNELNILADIVLDAHASGSDQVFHLSGPDMHEYTRNPDFQHRLSLMYDRVRTHVYPHLPRHVTLNLPAVHNMRWVVREDRADALNNLIAAYRQCVIDGKHAPLRAAALECTDVLYDIADANFMSQYDLLDGQDLYVHPEAYDMTFAQHDAMARTLLPLKPASVPAWQSS